MNTVVCRFNSCTQGGEYADHEGRGGWAQKF
jgi:hypothetical protein